MGNVEMGGGDVDVEMGGGTWILRWMRESRAVFPAVWRRTDRHPLALFDLPLCNNIAII